MTHVAVICSMLQCVAAFTIGTRQYIRDFASTHFHCPMTRVYPYTWLATTAPKKQVSQKQTPSFDFNCPMHKPSLPVHMAAKHFKKSRKKTAIYFSSQQQAANS